MAKVFIVDDTAIYRKILSEAVNAIDGLELAGTAPRGNIALQKLKQTPVDLVLLDIFMPEMDGLETLKEIKKEHPKMMVVMVSGATTRDAGITINALQGGAADFIPKPKAKSFSEGMPIIIGEVKRVASALGMIRSSAKVSQAPAPQPARSTPPPKASVPPRNVSMVVIGVSTGGPRTLARIIPKISGKLPCPILLVQHMPPMFTASLAEHLDKESELTVKEAEANEPVKNGHVYIAPGGKHMVLKKTVSNQYQIALNEDAPVNSCRPAVDVLFDSVAALHKGSVLAIILTGMGEDGARGVESLKQNSCYCISQSKDSCVVYGMPQAVESRGLADQVLDADRVAQRINELLRC